MVSLLIIVFNAIWSRVASSLNTWENHRTDTAFEDALIAKTFAFQVVNSYGALAYIAFVKEPVVNRMWGDVYAMCPYAQNSANMGRSCMSELGVQLFSIFVVKLLVDTLQTIAVPYLVSLKGRCCQGPDADDNDDDDDDDDDDDGEYEAPTGAAPGELFTTKRTKSLVELEYDKPEYHEVMGLFGDYSELAIQFGFATIFTAAFPMAPLMAFMNNYYQVRFDLYKISQLSRRPEPKSAEDVGTWESIFHAISTVAVVSNCALIVFVGGYLKDYQEWLPFHAVDSSAGDDASGSVQGYKWLVFFLMEHVILLGRMLLALIIEDVPGEVKIQIQRQDMVVAKLIENAASDGEEEVPDCCEEGGGDELEPGPVYRHIWHGDDDFVLASQDRAERRARAKCLNGGGEPRGGSATEEGREGL